MKLFSVDEGTHSMILIHILKGEGCVYVEEVSGLIGQENEYNVLLYVI